jgi:hypothetical protein
MREVGYQYQMIDEWISEHEDLSVVKDNDIIVHRDKLCSALTSTYSKVFS